MAYFVRRPSAELDNITLSVRLSVCLSVSLSVGNGCVSREKRETAALGSTTKSMQPPTDMLLTILHWYIQQNVSCVAAKWPRAESFYRLIRFPLRLLHEQFAYLRGVIIILRYPIILQ